MKVYLQGGLGNQICQVIAGHSIASSKGEKLEVSSKFRNSSGTYRPESVISLNFPFEFTWHEESVGRLSYQFWRAIRVISNFSPWSRRIVGRLSGVHFSNVIGFDGEIDSIRPKGICGYFQSTIYWNNLDQNLANEIFTNSSLSPIVEKLISEMNNKKVVGVHIRRGDYATEKNTIGQLSLDYFNNCISELTQKSDEIWIVTDSPEEVSRYFQQSSFKIRVLTELNNLHPINSLAILANFAELILSNSSFSLCSALIRREARVIHAPSPWFRNIANSNMALDPTWISHVSSWD